MFKPTGVFPGNQVLFHNPPVLEVPIPHYPKVSPNAVVGLNSILIGDVRVSDDVFIGFQNIIRADSSAPFFVGRLSNIQDFVAMHCFPGEHVIVDGRKWALYMEEKVSVLHHASVHGPVFVGENTLIGQHASIKGATIGRNCVILHGAVITSNVKIPDGHFVAPGAVIWKQEQADQLPPVPEEYQGLNAEVVDHYYRLGKSYRMHTPLFI